MIVRELITRLGFSTNAAQLQNAEKATERLRDRAERAAGAFRNIVGAIASLAAVKNIASIADEMQGIRARLGDLPQTVGTAGEAFDTVAKRASAAGQSIDAYAALYTRIGHAAKGYLTTQADVLQVTDTISNVLKVSGASTQEAASVMTQFSQALASGVLQGDEFRSMAEAAPQYLDKLSEAMNIPRERLKAMASEGQLTTRQVIDATRKMSDYFAQRAKDMPMTMGMAFQIGANRFSAMIDRMNRDTGAIPRMAKFVADTFNAVADGIEGLADKVGGFANLLRPIGIALGVAFGAKAIALLQAFGVTSLAAMLPLLKIVAIVGVIALALEDLYVWIQGGDSLIGDLIGPWSKWEPYVTAVINAVKANFALLWERIKIVGDLLKAIFTLDVALFKKSLAALDDSFKKQAELWGGWLRDGIMDPLTAAFDNWWAKLTGNFSKFGGWVAELFGFGGEEKGWDRVGKVGMAMARNAVPVAVAGAALMTGTASATTGSAAPSLTPPVAPQQLTGGSSTVVNAPVTTNVNVTVPPGTTVEQVKVIESAAQVSFNDLMSKRARDISTYTR